MTIAGTTPRTSPAPTSAYGTHTVTWHATDGAGNVRDGFWTFTVRDAVAPVLSDVRPDDGSSTSDATPVISVAVADAGVGVDPASIAMTVDGNDVSAHGAFAGGRFTYTPSAPLGFGQHTVVVRASDLAGQPLGAAHLVVRRARRHAAGRPRPHAPSPAAPCPAPPRSGST